MRQRLEKDIQNLCDNIINNSNDDNIEGKLNYVITSILTRVMHTDKEMWRYRTMSRAVAVLECAKLEFYRRVGTRQENAAIQKNGDIEEYKEN